MEIFALLRKHLAICGIELTQKPSPSHPFNVKNLIVVILLYVFVILSIASLNEANTYEDYTDILYLSVSIGVCGIVYVIIVWKSPELLRFLDSLAEIVNESE